MGDKIITYFEVSGAIFMKSHLRNVMILFLQDINDLKYKL